MLLALFPGYAALGRAVFPPSTVPAMILVAVGANLPGADGRTPYQSCLAAVEALRRLPDLTVTAVSRWYRSAPVPRSDQPDYVNGVVRLEALPSLDEPDPAALLRTLQQIEQTHGRRRGAANAARTLDLDIIAMGERGSLICQAPDLVLPHPRAMTRLFVLLPLHDVAPAWVHPVCRLTAVASRDRLLLDHPPHELPSPI